MYNSYRPATLRSSTFTGPLVFTRGAAVSVQVPRQTITACRRVALARTQNVLTPLTLDFRVFSFTPSKSRQACSIFHVILNVTHIVKGYLLTTATRLRQELQRGETTRKASLLGRSSVGVKMAKFGLPTGNRVFISHSAVIAKAIKIRTTDGPC